MVKQHLQLNGHEFEQILEDSEGQESLACYSAWGGKEQDVAQQLNNSCRSSLCLGISNSQPKVIQLIMVWREKKPVWKPSIFAFHIQQNPICKYIAKIFSNIYMLPCFPQYSNIPQIDFPYRVSKQSCLGGTQTNHVFSYIQLVPLSQNT